MSKDHPSHLASNSDSGSNSNSGSGSSSAHGPAGVNMDSAASWAIAMLIGLMAGVGIASVVPLSHIAVPLWLVGPFAALLLSIALLPFAAPAFWHKRYPEVALALGGLVLGIVLRGLGEVGEHHALHAVKEYYSFIALVAGLFVISGGILIDIRGRATPIRNVLLLAGGAVLANFVGTTGASALLIRPLLRTNQGRIRPMHVVFFIFIVSNCGGCLTPIGDPPLYLGFLNGVPFLWTLTHLWPDWLLVNGCLVTIFFFLDRRISLAPSLSDTSLPPKSPAPHSFDPSHRTPLIKGWGSIAALIAVVLLSFFDPLVGARFGVGYLPIGPTLQIVVAILAWRLTPPSIHAANRFNFEPIREVGLLFAGIFLTMIPALRFLEQNASSLGLTSPTHKYFAAGLLSSMLDNAPTYLSFLQLELALMNQPMSPAGVGVALSTPAGQSSIVAISLGAVFFGAMTYIGNGPNLMVKAVAESAGGQHSVRMPSFFGYVGWSVAILLPVLVLNWAVLIR